MNFKKHFELEGKHAIFSPSKPGWLTKNEEQLSDYIRNENRKIRGTRMHRLAKEHIDLKIKMPRSSSDTFSMFINDAIGFGMTPEQPLQYSRNVFGTTDAISMSERQNILRVHDLKTGKTPARIEQLIAYAALFCLEYGIKPSDIETELRIYQLGNILTVKPEQGDISKAMDQIILADKIAEDIMGEQYE